MKNYDVVECANVGVTDFAGTLIVHANVDEIVARASCLSSAMGSSRSVYTPFRMKGGDHSSSESDAKSTEVD